MTLFEHVDVMQTGRTSAILVRHFVISRRIAYFGCKVVDAVLDPNEPFYMINYRFTVFFLLGSHSNSKHVSVGFLNLGASQAIDIFTLLPHQGITLEDLMESIKALTSKVAGRNRCFSDLPVDDFWGFESLEIPIFFCQKSQS